MQNKNPPMPHGHLIIIGGSEDRQHDKEILTRFIETAGGRSKKIVVITAASTVPDDVWDMYQKAFDDLGVDDCVHLPISARADANDPELTRCIDEADGIFMTGGDQKRLLAMIGGTELDKRIHYAFKVRGASIAGTSAGASAMSGHMLAEGKAELQPEKGAINLSAGLGLVVRVVIDQHFSQRHRIPRLLTLVAQNPYLFGIGIDEDTALIIERGKGVEVIGAGIVTIIDGRHMISDIADRSRGECPVMVDVRMHILPSGTRYARPAQAAPGDTPEAEAGAAPVPAALVEFVQLLTTETAFNENC